MPFLGSLTREALFDGFMRRREELTEVVRVSAEWVDGSFVTAKRDAGDIDIVTLIQETDIARLDLAARQRLGELTDRHHCQLVYGCDTYLMVVVEENSTRHKRYLRERGYWDRWWSKFNGRPDTKGYLEVRSE